MNRLISSAGTVFAAAAFALGLAPSGGAALAAGSVGSDLVQVQVPTTMSDDPQCTDCVGCVLAHPCYRQPRKWREHRSWDEPKLKCHQETIDQHTKWVCEPARR